METDKTRLAKCARCSKIFSKEDAPVCPRCMPEEEADYEKITLVISEHPGLGIDGVAQKAQVNTVVVLRMLQSGRIEAKQEDNPYLCGRCGKPAISQTKRLCEACLLKLDREWAETLREMRKNMVGKVEASTQAVHESLNEKRLGIGGFLMHDKRNIPKGAPSAGTSRSALEEKRDKTQRKP